MSDLFPHVVEPLTLYVFPQTCSILQRKLLRNHIPSKIVHFDMTNVSISVEAIYFLAKSNIRSVFGVEKVVSSIGRVVAVVA
jgi:hypothetical protein